MGREIPISKEAAYATKGNIAFPGTAAERTAAQTKAIADINAAVIDQTGTGITVSAASIIAAR